MSTRIIIEKDGERYVANDLIPEFLDSGKPLCITNKETYEYVSSTFTQLPPVIRTDNSEVIANLEADNEKLREALKPIIECKCNFDISWSFNDGTLLAYAVPMYDAVRKAQEIMKGEKE